MHGRVISTYPESMASIDTLPPFVHPQQVSRQKVPVPLANCISITRMADSGFGDPFEEGLSPLIRETVKKEADRLCNEFESYDDDDLLAAMQALMIYTIMLTRSSMQDTPQIDQTLFVAIQGVAYRMSTTGLLLPAEASGERPCWPAWTSVAAKRRVLLTLYCWESYLAVSNDLPLFPSDEIGFMPAPEPRALWYARGKEEWEAAYNRHLARWGGKLFRVDELKKWRMEKESARRYRQWLLEVDGFGMMMAYIVHAAGRCARALVADARTVKGSVVPPRASSGVTGT